MIQYLLKLVVPRLTRTLLSGVLFFLMGAAWFGPLGIAAHPPAADLDTAAIDAFLETEMDRHRIQGLALAITEGDEVVHARGYGTAGEGHPVRADTPFYLGSVSKSLTALAVMQLVEAGKVELDQPVQTYLPWFEVADPEASRQITVRHLLNQTSGLSRTSYVEVLPSRDASIEDGVRALSNARPTAPVGTEFHYFNPNYATLGLLIERVTGQSYGEYMRTRVYGPLQMEQSFTSRAEAEEAGLAQGYNVLFGFPVPRTQPYLIHDLPAGFLISSAEDMAHYLIAQLNGGHYEDQCLLSSEGLVEMHTPPPGIDSSYGMGWELQERDGSRLLRHDGTLEAFYASAVLLPDENFGVVLLANQVSFPHMLLAYEGMVQGVVDHLTGHAPNPGISTTAVYLVLSVIAVMTLAVQIRSLLHRDHWREQIQERGFSRSVLGVLWKLTFGLLVLLILPWLLIQNAGLTAAKVSLLNYLPDVSLWLGSMAALSLTEAGWRSWHLVEMKRRKR